MEKIWQSINDPKLGLMDSISDLIAQQEQTLPDLLTSIRHGHTIFMAADFSGQHELAKYESYAFLIADFVYLWLWEEMRQKVRQEYLNNHRRMSFKKLADSQRRNALVPFLRAANCIPGLCITVLIDKSIPSLFQKNDRLDMSSSEYDGYRHWKPHVFEKLLRVAHFSALLISCMSSPRQNLIWFIDEDEIVPNEQRLQEACRICSHILAHYLQHDLGNVRLGTTKSDDGSLSIEDLAAIPDLVAGAFCELAPSLALVNNLNDEVGLINTDLTGKAQTILNWFTDPIHTLKKIIVSIDKNEAGEIIPRCIRFDRLSHSKEFFWHKEAKDIFNKVT